MKKTVYILLTLVLILSGMMSVSADVTVTPMYVAHPCHTGPSHQYCDLKCVITRSCGCIYEQYKCCCGYSMPIVFVNLCSTHDFRSSGLSTEYMMVEESSMQLTTTESHEHSEAELSAIPVALHGEEDMVSPMYVAHDCHTGPSHRICEWWKFTYTCGCKQTNYECCCGANMGDDTVYCSKHSWTNPPYL